MSLSAKLTNFVFIPTAYTMNHHRLFPALAIVLALASCNRFRPEDGVHTLHVLTTNDVHGSWFDSSYTDGTSRTSLLAAKTVTDSVKALAGASDVLMLDAGDCLQGDNAAYYFNYVDTLSPHLFTKLVSRLGYDAVVVGNHDVETGHPVYDRVNRELEDCGIPFLAGNAVRTDNGKPYFRKYATFIKAGVKVLVLGYTNPNIKAWLDEKLWEGIDFKSLIPLVQEDVDTIVAKEQPQVVIVAAHSGTGQGDGSVLENQTLDLFRSLKGVDMVIGAHDHRPLVMSENGMVLLNSGSNARMVAHGTISVETKGGKIVSKEYGAELLEVRKDRVDPALREEFREDYEAVKAFTLKPVGKLGVDLVTRDAFKGMCPYLNLIHTIGLQMAEVSIAAPLTFNKTVNKGTLIYNDLFTIYPFENQLFVIKLSGDELRRYLEYSYDGWIQTVPDPVATAKGLNDSHVLKIAPQGESRNGLQRWSFVNQSFNFDAAAGLYYTVDVTKPYGERVQITAMANGSEFDADREYTVAMTSYRASGGGDILRAGVGIEDVNSRIISKNAEYRNLIYDYLVEHSGIYPEVINDSKVIGGWHFVPEAEVATIIDRDLALVLGR